MSNSPTREELRAARAVAVDLNLTASAKESEARKARAKADAAQKHYDDLVLIAQGQMTLPYGT